MKYIEKKTKKLITIIIFIVLFLLSLGFNAYWIIRSYQEKRAIKDIVNERIDPIINQAKEENEDINKRNEEFTDNLHRELENQSVQVRNIDKEQRKQIMENIKNSRNNILEDNSYIPNIVNISPINNEIESKSIEKGQIESVDEQITHTVIIEDKAYDIELANNLKDSQEQTIFYMDRLTMTTNHYLQIIQEKDELIKNLTEQLEEAKKDLTNDITERNVNIELERFRKNFSRFGIDLYIMAGLPISDWIENKGLNTNFLSYEAGVGWNWLLINKFNIRLMTGIEYRSPTIEPKIGLSVGYYFD